MKWYTLAVAQGNSDAESALAALEETIEQMEQLKQLITQAERGDAESQYQIALMYESGKSVEKDLVTAISWAKKSRSNDHLKGDELYRNLIIKDFIYGSDIRALDKLSNAFAANCNLKCVFDKGWGLIDITKDGFLSLAEIARFQRNLVKYAVVKQEKETLDTGEIAGINLVSILALPVTASSVLHSFDYNNDNVLSKNEVIGDETELASLIGKNGDKLPGELNFESLGNRLRKSMGILELFK